MPGPRTRSVSLDLSNVEFETSENVEVIPIFDKLNLKEDLLRGIYNYGKFKTPNLIFLTVFHPFLVIKNVEISFLFIKVIVLNSLKLFVLYEKVSLSIY